MGIASEVALNPQPLHKKEMLTMHDHYREGNFHSLGNIRDS